LISNPAYIRQYRLGLKALAVLLCLILSPVGHANPASDTLSINMRDADIRAVVQWMADETGRHFIVDPRVNAKITILSSAPMTRDEAYQVFLHALNVYGFSAVETGSSVRIVPDATAKTAGSAVIDAFMDKPDARQATYAIRVHNVPSQQLAALLKPLVAPGGYIGAALGTNMLVIADNTDNIKRINRLVSQLDSQGKLDVSIVSLKHASATEVVELLSELTGRGENGQGASGGAQFAADERSNTLLVSGSATQRQQLLTLIKKLDQPVASESNTRVFYLHYLKAEELAEILSNIVDKRDTGNERARQRFPVSIEASATTNALIISAPPLLMNEMEQVINKLDIRQAQVLVEAIIVEVDNEFVDNLGVQWSTSLSNSDGLEGVTDFSLIPDLDIDPALPAPNPLLLAGNGLTLGYFRNGSLRAVVNALAAENAGNILSTPSIITLDNHEAEILVGSNVPFKTGESTGSANDTTNPFTTIEREDIGVTLRITPQINQGDAITLDILQEVETLTPSTFAEDIITDKRSIRTKVLLEDDDILVLGGLIQDETNEIVQKVPLLGDIPLLGALFRNTTEQVTKKNLMVFIHAVIMSDMQFAEQESLKRYNNLRQLQIDQQDPEKRKSRKKSAVQLPEFESYKSREN
jgi:general secretion pathway protein D